jgi:hypothetical protein
MAGKKKATPYKATEFSGLSEAKQQCAFKEAAYKDLQRAETRVAELEAVLRFIAMGLEGHSLEYATYTIHRPWR